MPPKSQTLNESLDQEYTYHLPSAWKRTARKAVREQAVTVLATALLVLCFLMVCYMYHENTVVATMVKLNITKK